VTFGMSMAYRGSCATCVRLRKDIFTVNPRDMACVSWNMLFANFVCGTSDPVTSISTPVSEYILIRLIRGCLTLLVESFSISASSWHHVNSLTSTQNDLSIDITCSHAKHIILLRHMACVAWKIFLGKWFALL